MRRFEREVGAIECDCGGYAERVDCTKEEIKEYNCGRNYVCCARTFVCKICGERISGKAEAPEME